MFFETCVSTYSENPPDYITIDSANSFDKDVLLPWHNFGFKDLNLLTLFQSCLKEYLLPKPMKVKPSSLQLLVPLLDPFLV